MSTSRVELTLVGLCQIHIGWFMTTESKFMKKNSLILKAISTIAALYLIATSYYSDLASRRYLCTILGLLLIVGLLSLSLSQKLKLILTAIFVTLLFVGKIYMPYQALSNAGFSMGLAVLITFLYISIIMVLISRISDLFEWCWTRLFINPKNSR